MTTAPTEFEQMMLELINRARSDPSGELDHLILQDDPVIGAESGITGALRFFQVDIALLRSQLDGVAAVAPVAWNENLATSADTHSQLMLDFDEQSHNLPGEPGLGDRIRDAGYSFSRAGENIFAFTESPVQGHAGFYIDWGFGPGGIQDPAGHRNAILSPNFTEVGLGVLEQTDPNADTGPFLVTQHFGDRFGTNTFLTGVVIDDLNDDDFYGFGEGLGGVSVEATGINGTTGSFSTVTYATGGYTLEVTNGTYEVTFSGGALGGTVTKTVTVNGENVKVDAEVDETGVGVTLTGDGSADVLTGSVNGDQLSGLGAGDTLDGRGGEDSLYGGGGNDTLMGGDGDDMLDGGAGNDVVNGGAGIDTGLYDSFGGAVNLNLNLTAAQDANAAGIETISSVENLIGGLGNDRFTGSTADNQLVGAGGSDRLFGLGGADDISGGAGNDKIQGGAGNDVLSGGIGIDALLGGAGEDSLTGGDDNDQLRGGQGADTLDGGLGRDVLIGGDFSGGGFPGDGASDLFRFNAVAESAPGGATRDVIRDFEQGLDTIDLAPIDANESNGDGDDAFTFIGAAAFSGTAGELRAFTTGLNTVIRGDVDGDGTGDLEIFVNGTIVFQDTDFML